MNVRALLFASLRDLAGARAIEVDVEEPATVDDVTRRLAGLHPALGERLPRVRVAVNDRLAEPSTPLAAGDEVAYLPPVSGGGGDWIEVVEDAISVDRVLASVRRTDCGAVVLFLGTVRDHFQGVAVVGMEYEAHRAMAERSLGELADEARARWKVGAISVVHRIGRLDLGEISVAVAVSAPHRGEAFETGRFVIDRLKETVPIWKRELLESGEVWIEGEDRVPRPTRKGIAT
jgi:molybdopterin synthase catalytic subunit